MKHTMMVSAAALLAGVALTGSANAAVTCTPIYGGGGTLAAKAYRLFFDAASVTGNHLYKPKDFLTAGNNPATCQKTGPEVLYAPVGSGNGLKAYTTNDPTMLGTPSTTNTVPYTSLSFPAYPYPDLDFAGSDAALGTLATQVIAAAGPAIELASFGTPVTISLNTTTFPASGSGYDLTKLTVTQICALYTIGTNINSSTVALSHPISEVVARADGSGTTFLLSTFLSENCGSTPYPFTNPPSTSTTTFASVPGIKLVSGSGGVAGEIAATAGAVGYVSPDFVRPIVKTAGAAPAPIIEGTKSYTPSKTNVQKHIGNYDPTGKSGLQINSDLLGPTQEASNGGYPISGVTFLDVYTNYADNVGSQLQTILAQLYVNPTTHGSALNGIAAQTGLVPLGFTGSNFPAVENAQLATINSNVAGGV